MSDFSVHKTLEEVHERGEHAKNNPTVAIAAAVLAVLAALATMLALNRSTLGLVEKNQTILSQARASDTYNYYEATKIKAHLYEALHEAGLGDPKEHARLQAEGAREERKSAPLLLKAQTLETQSSKHEEHSEVALKAYETFEVAVTLFEVSIVFVSISALAASRTLLWIAGVSSIIGVIFLAMGLAHF